MSAKQVKKRYVLLMLLGSALLLWNVATPVVNIYYSEYARDEIRYIWNTQHRIHKERMAPGNSTFDRGHIFPDKDFFMMFDWWAERGLQNCIYVIPKWPRTIIYLDMNGNIDTRKTASIDLARLKSCPWSRTKVSRDY